MTSFTATETHVRWTSMHYVCDAHCENFMPAKNTQLAFPNMCLYHGYGSLTSCPKTLNHSSARPLMADGTVKYWVPALSDAPWPLRFFVIAGLGIKENSHWQISIYARNFCKNLKNKTIICEQLWSECRIWNLWTDLNAARWMIWLSEPPYARLLTHEKPLQHFEVFHDCVQQCNALELTFLFMNKCFPEAILPVISLLPHLIRAANFRMILHRRLKY